VETLSAGEEPLCFCSTELAGGLTGEMILAFDDASGLALADMLLGKPPGATNQWTDLAVSAALETANIVCCAYLNSLAESLSSSRGHDAADASGPPELLPSPPRFSRDFAQSLMQFALLGQAVASDEVIVAKTRFEIDAAPVNWTLLFIPDAPARERLLGLARGGRHG
jgi:chemotaxis protein CheC